MAGDKYFYNNSGKIKEKASIQSSAGAGDAGKIPSLDSAGLLDVSMMPVGVGAEVVVAASSENLTAGDFINLYSNAGTINVRKADATTNAKPADGFVLANVTSPASATVYLISAINTAVSGLTVGADYYLSTTPGTVTSTAPSAAGNIIQRLGKARTAAALIFEHQDYYELA